VAAVVFAIVYAAHALVLLQLSLQYWGLDFHYY
jgi:hypothetical protein